MKRCSDLVKDRGDLILLILCSERSSKEEEILHCPLESSVKLLKMLMLGSTARESGIIGLDTA